MKALKVILIIIVTLVAIFFIGGIFLPKTYDVNRSISINAPDSVVYNNVSNFNIFKLWNPWYKMEPSAKIKISGPVAQAGHLYQWEGKETGTGQMLVLNAQPSRLVDIELKFIKPFESTANTQFNIEPITEGTKVIWSMSGENKSTMDKWMGLCMDKMIGKDFESGLENLKKISEKR